MWPNGSKENACLSAARAGLDYELSLCTPSTTRHRSESGAGRAVESRVEPVDQGASLAGKAGIER